MIRFETVREKVLHGERLEKEDAAVLWAHPNLLDVAQLAHHVRIGKHGLTTYYNWNLHLNSTNVCEASCLFCSFARLKTGMPQAYTMNVERAHQWISERYKTGMTEIHIVNGLNPDLDFQYYLDLLTMIRRDFPALHIKAFTAVEIHYFAVKYSMSYQEVLRSLQEVGLGSLPGGGAEIFSERVRKKICRDKATSEEWLEVHRVAHTLGIKSNCTMLYGTIETIEERTEHLVRLRALQDETGGFQVFIPLAFHNEGNKMERLPAPTAAEDLRVISVSRLMLDSMPHIKAYWVMLGIKTAQTALLCGANDLDGTVTEEKIYHMAGSHSPDALSLPEIQHVIKAAGLIPQERTTTYERVERPADIGSEA